MEIGVGRELVTADAVMSYTRRVGPLRWRGALNWKDITERVIAGTLSGISAGVSFWVLTRLFE